MHSKHTSAGRDLCLFALPMLIGNILQSCYAMADMAVVGRYVGADALAAVSNTAMISFISAALTMGFTMGGAVLVARFRGAGDEGGQRETVRTLLAVSAVGGMILTAVNYALYPPVLDLMRVPADALPLAAEYMDIVGAGNFFVFGYNAVCAVLRGLGDSRRPLYFVAVAAAVNVALDFLFVAGFGWGVRGAAAATVIAQAASCAAGYAVLTRRLGRQAFRISPGVLRELFRLGLPTATHSAVLNLSYMAVTALFNGHGVAAAAAAGIGLKVNTFVAMPCWAAGMAVAAMAGHAAGAKSAGRAARVARAGVAAGLLSTGVLLIGMQVFARPFLGMFTQDAEVIDLGVRYLRICCSVNFIPYCIMYILNSFAVGTGAPVFAMANSILQSVAVRLGLSLVFTACGYGYFGLCVAEAVSPLPSCLLVFVYYKYGRWRGAEEHFAIDD